MFHAVCLRGFASADAAVLTQPSSGLHARTCGFFT